MSKRHISITDPNGVSKTIVATIQKVHYATDTFILELNGKPIGGLNERD